MRLVAQIPHPACRISILSWNGKFILKFEAGLLEQTFKVSESEAGEPAQFIASISPEFIKLVLENFNKMENAFHEILDL